MKLVPFPHLYQSSQVKSNYFSGFTLVEVLVVVTIVAVLATVVVTNYGSVQAAARDQVRVSELEQIQLALSLYRQDTGAYPSESGSICSIDSPVCGGTTFFNTLSNLVLEYGGLAVSDPLHGTDDFRYVYDGSVSCNGTYEVSALRARLESVERANYVEVSSRCPDLGYNSSDYVIILEFRN